MLHMGRLRGETSTDKKQTLPSLHHVLTSALQTLKLGCVPGETFWQTAYCKIYSAELCVFFIVKFTVCCLIKLSVAGKNFEAGCCCVCWRVAEKVKRELRCLSSSRCLREKYLCILNVSTAIYIFVSSRNKTRRFLFSLRLHYVPSFLSPVPAQPRSFSTLNSRL